MILDTTILVDLLRGEPAASEKVAQLEESGDLLWVPAPAIFELWEGLERSDRPYAERRRIEEVLAGYTVLAFEGRHASRAGEISGRLVRRGEMMDPIDAQIAGMATVEGTPVLTRNKRHFERVSDLTIVTY